MNKQKGLYLKYHIEKTDGSPIDPYADYLVLRLDNGEYVEACRDGALAFAEAVRSANPDLAHAIRTKVFGYRLRLPEDARSAGGT